MNKTGAHFAETEDQTSPPGGTNLPPQQEPNPATMPAAKEQMSDPAVKKTEDRPVTTGTQTPEQPTPLRADSTTGGQAPVAIPRSPAALKKTVIPPRPTPFENGHRAPVASRKSAWTTQEDREVADQPTSALPAVDGSLLPPDELADQPTAALAAPPQGVLRQPERTEQRPYRPPSAGLEPENERALAQLPTTPILAVVPADMPGHRRLELTRGRALLLGSLLLILIVNATVTGAGQFFGPQSWSAILSPAGTTNQALLNQLRQELQHTPTPGGTGQPGAHLTPAQIVQALLAHMTLAQKLGQMLMVRFNSPDYSPQLDAMLTSYHVGSVIEYQGNIASSAELTSLNAQIQQHGDLPMIIAIDQEGGTVDRLRNLDGPQPSASSIGATHDSRVAYQQGLKDAQDLFAYGFNLNLAPVVDVNNVYNSQLYERTYSTDPALVATLAGAYLSGLQQSGKVLGTVKHFPGLGDTSTDPHYGLPYLTRSLDNLNAVDWVPYQRLISQGHVYAVMVTHEIVRALDPGTPSSLSPRVIGILRNQLGFQGVIITDGLTMRGITNSYTLGQAAVLAVQAGDDLLMDPGSPNEVAQMVDSLSRAVQSGAISQQRIDDSVRRILLLKYQMDLLHIHV
jgi:beta-N-acetylhexosaminidase